MTMQRGHCWPGMASAVLCCSSLCSQPGVLLTTKAVIYRACGKFWCPSAHHVPVFLGHQALPHNLLWADGHIVVSCLGGRRDNICFQPAQQPKLITIKPLLPPLSIAILVLSLLRASHL